MPDIVNPTAVAFANNYIRRAADRKAQDYYYSKQVVQSWNAQSLSALFPNDTSNVVDGSATDGRPPITGAMVNNIINRASETIADYEATSNAKLNTILQVAVDTNP